jgi:DNA-directed RNA polymerase specialized sigma24 family protein
MPQSGRLLHADLWAETILFPRMHMTTLLNRMDITLDEVALIPSEAISNQWTSELRKIVGLHPSCKLLRELWSLDRSTRTVLYPFLIKGWSPRRIADRLKVSLNTIHELLEIGREHLKRKLGASS